MWKPAYFCQKCDVELDEREVYFSDGMCPECGNQETPHSTVVDVYTKPYRLTELRPWWAFWRGPRYVREWL